MLKKIKKLKNKKNKQGFTLMEVLVAVFIFVLMVSAVSGIFIKMVQSYHYAKVAQKDLESAQYAMNLMMKTLRTSSIIDNLSDVKLRIYDYSQEKCIEYEFSGNDLLYRSAGDGGSLIDKDSCGAHIFTESSNLIEGSVSQGIFDAVASDENTMGKVTASLIISTDNDKNKIRIQSSVSLRDYVSTSTGP